MPELWEPDNFRVPGWLAALTTPKGTGVAKTQFVIELERLSPPAGRLFRPAEGVPTVASDRTFVGWLDFLRALSDELGLTARSISPHPPS